MKFLSETHEERFNLILKFSGRTTDRERLPLFYILAAFEDTSANAEKFYDFSKNCIRPGMLSRVELDYPSHLELVRLGYNLYNSAQKCNICDTFISCGSGGSHYSRRIALEAIKIRFGMED